MKHAWKSYITVSRFCRQTMGIVLYWPVWLQRWVVCLSFSDQYKSQSSGVYVRAVHVGPEAERVAVTRTQLPASPDAGWHRTKRHSNQGETDGQSPAGELCMIPFLETLTSEHSVIVAIFQVYEAGFYNFKPTVCVNWHSNRILLISCKKFLHKHYRNFLHCNTEWAWWSNE